MTFNLERSIDLLQRTPQVLNAQLRDLDDAWTMHNYGDGTFSACDVVGHLVHGEIVDWIPRLHIILEHGEARPFDPFIIEDMYDIMRGKSLNNLLDEFATLRMQNVNTLRAMKLSESQLTANGMHPALGPVTAGEMIGAWTAHDLHHIAQIQKAMVYQYRYAPGPWREYLGIVAQFS